jgi:hypothetical protein
MVAQEILDMRPGNYTGCEKNIFRICKRGDRSAAKPSGSLSAFDHQCVDREAQFWSSFMSVGWMCISVPEPSTYDFHMPPRGVPTALVNALGPPLTLPASSKSCHSGNSAVASRSLSTAVCSIKFASAYSRLESSL